MYFGHYEWRLLIQRQFVSSLVRDVQGIGAAGVWLFMWYRLAQWCCRHCFLVQGKSWEGHSRAIYVNRKQGL